MRDANAITATPIKNRSEQSLVEAYTMLYNNLKASGLSPKLQIYNNQCSAAFKRFLCKKDIRLKLVPPMITGQTRPKKPSTPSNVTSLLDSLASLPRSCSTFGTNSSSMQYSPLTSLGSYNCTPKSLPTNTFLETTTTTATQLPYQTAKSLRATALVTAQPGTANPLIAGTLAQPSITTAAT